MPIRGELWISPVCGRGHHDDCQAGDNDCECACHRGEEPDARPVVDLADRNGTSGFAAPDVRAAVEEMRAPDMHADTQAGPFPCKDPTRGRADGCDRVYPTLAGARTHYARIHGPRSLARAHAPQARLKPKPTFTTTAPIAPERPSGPASRTIAPERQAFLDKMRALRDELADAEEIAERELAQMRAVIVALDAFLD